MVAAEELMSGLFAVVIFALMQAVVSHPHEANSPAVMLTMVWSVASLAARDPRSGVCRGSNELVVEST